MVPGEVEVLLYECVHESHWRGFMDDEGAPRVYNIILPRRAPIAAFPERHLRTNQPTLVVADLTQSLKQ